MQNSQKKKTELGAFRPFLLINLKDSGLELYKKETPTHLFFCEFSEIFKNTFFYKTPLDGYFLIKL